MKLSYNDLFLKILSLLYYPNKEKYVKEFEEMNHMEAMTNCIKRLPQHTREYIMTRPLDPTIIRNYISKDEYMQELTIVSTDAARLSAKIDTSSYR